MSDFHHGKVRGFTLIELMVTISIAAILMMIAVPSFVAFQRNSELTSAANSLLAALNSARSEAMKRNVNVFIVPADGSTWTSGWKIFVDKNFDGAYSTGEDIVLTGIAMPSYFSSSATHTAGVSPEYFAFNGSGYSIVQSTNGPALGTITIKRNDISGTELLEQTRRIMVSFSGRIRICKPASDSDPKCPSSASE